MNNNEVQVIRYLSGEMSGDELLTFELQLNNSDELKKLVSEYSSVFNKVNEQKSVEGNYFYFENILQKFYNRNKVYSRKGIIKRLAYSSVIIVFVFMSYIAFNDSQSGNVIDLSTITEDVSEDQILSIIDEYSLVDNADLNSISSNTIFDQQINSFYENSFQNITSHLNVSDLTEKLTDSESERIFSELINKKIL